MSRDQASAASRSFLDPRSDRKPMRLDIIDDFITTNDPSRKPTRSRDTYYTLFGNFRYVLQPIIGFKSPAWGMMKL
ncbi:hypothetical protein KC336_g15 [Hortaea werneckii]|nr:hypothetical protein KC336_g15 [Hortaea werneckii]